MNFLVLFILGFLINPPGLYAQSEVSPIVWRGDLEKIDLRQDLEFFSDEPGPVRPLSEILAFDPKTFTPLKNIDSKFFGYSDRTLWFRVAVENASGRDQDLVIGSVRPEHTSFDVNVIRQDGSIQTYHLGSAVPLAKRPFASRLCLAPLVLKKGEKATVLMSLRSSQSISLQFSLTTPAEALLLEKIEDCSLFFYFGATCLLVLYSVILGFSLKHVTYHLYSIFGITIAFCTFVYSGWMDILGFQLFFIKGSADTPRILLIPTICSGIYCHRFFRLDQLAPRLRRISLIMIGFAVISALLNMSRWGGNFRQLIPLSQMGLFFCIFAMIYAGLRAKIPGSRYQAMAWLVFFATSVVWALGNEGVLEKNYAVAFAVLYGNIFEMLMGAIALGAYVRDLERKKFDATIQEKESLHLRTLVFVVCHDIANPLTVILGAAGLMTSHLGKEEKPLRLLKKIQHGADIITSIIQQVRRLESVRSGKYQPQLEPVSITSIFNELLFLFADRAESKGIRLLLNDEGMPMSLAVLAEPTSLINDVLNNFISNALKFSHEGGTVEVQVSYDKDRVRIKVIDQGIGMPQALIDKLFEAGATTSRPGTLNEIGTGFGMPLAKYFVDRFGGGIEVHSVEKEEGSSVAHGTTIITSLIRVELLPDPGPTP